MPIAVQDTPEAPSARRKARATTSSAPPPRRRRTLQMLLAFVTLVLIINALVGERGLVQTLRARRQHEELVGAIDRLRADNASLREEARRLRTDPAAIEALARQELGLIRPGEMLFIIKDTKPAQPATR